MQEQRDNSGFCMLQYSAAVPLAGTQYRAPLGTFQVGGGAPFQLEHGHLLLSRDRLDLLVGQDLALVLREDIVTNQRRQLRRGLCVCFCTAHILSGLRRKATMLCGVVDGVTSGSSNWHDVASVSRSRPRGADARLRCLCELRFCL